MAAHARLTTAPRVTRPSDNALSELAAGLEDRFAAAAERAGAVEHRAILAGTAITLRFAGEALVPQVMPALAGGDGAAARPRAVGDGLTVCLWDTESTATALPRSPLMPRAGSVLAPDLDDGARALHFQVGESIVTFLDRARGIALVAAARARWPLWERAAPLRWLWQSWLAARGTALVHAAAVGLPGGNGCMLTGPGGSGKSTTAILCHRAGLLCAGDDYVLLDADALTAHPVYRSAKLDWRRADLLAEVRNPPDEEKALGFLDERTEPVGIGSILTASVGRRSRTAIADGSAVRALRDLAPRAVLQVPGGAAMFARLARVTRTVPCRQLDLGSDESAVVDAIVGHLRG